MASVHVLASTGRFRSLGEMREYIDETYTEAGDGVPSALMAEVGLDEYQPGCIEAVRSDSGRPVPLAELLSPSLGTTRGLREVRTEQPLLSCSRPPRGRTSCCGLAAAEQGKGHHSSNRRSASKGPMQRAAPVEEAGGLREVRM